MGRLPSTPEGCLDAMLEWREKHTSNVARTIDFYRETVGAVFRIMRLTECRMLPYKTTTGDGPIDEDDIRKILNYMEDVDLAIATRIGYIRAIATYCNYYKNDVVDRMNIQWPEDTRPNADWLTQEQMWRLLEYPMNPLQRLAVQFMGRMGLRRIECIRMKIKDIQAKFVTVRGKGHMSGKLRNVPLREGMGKIIEAYMKYRDGLIAEARSKDPAVEVPEEVFINWNQGLLRPYEEDGWGFDKAVVVPLRKKLGFPLFEPYLKKNIREDAVEGRRRSADNSDHSRTQFDRDDDQIFGYPHGRHGVCYGEDAVLITGGEA